MFCHLVRIACQARVLHIGVSNLQLCAVACDTPLGGSLATIHLLRRDWLVRLADEWRPVHDVSLSSPSYIRHCLNRCLEFNMKLNAAILFETAMYYEVRVDNSQRVLVMRFSADGPCTLFSYP